MKTQLIKCHIHPKNICFCICKLIKNQERIWLRTSLVAFQLEIVGRSLSCFIHPMFYRLLCVFCTTTKSYDDAIKLDINHPDYFHHFHQFVTPLSQGPYAFMAGLLLGIFCSGGLVMSPHQRVAKPISCQTRKLPSQKVAKRESCQMSKLSNQSVAKTRESLNQRVYKHESRQTRQSPNQTRAIFLI